MQPGLDCSFDAKQMVCLVISVHNSLDQQPATYFNLTLVGLGYFSYLSASSCVLRLYWTMSVYSNRQSHCAVLTYVLGQWLGAGFPLIQSVLSFSVLYHGTSLLYHVLFGFTSAARLGKHTQM